jgi:hypothetical protein
MSVHQPDSLRPGSRRLHQLRLEAARGLEAGGHQIGWRNYDIPGDRGYDMSRARCINSGCHAVWVLYNISGGLDEFEGRPIGPCPNKPKVK